MNTSYKYSIDKIKNYYSQKKQGENIPKYIILYNAIKHCILKIELPNNWLLPSTRLLAKELNISRTTVNKTYEILQLEKLIIAKAGSGYRINYDPSQTETNDSKKELSHNKKNYPKISDIGIAYQKNITLVNKVFSQNIAFRPGLPPLDVFPVNTWKNLLNNYWRHIKSSSLSYSTATGLIELKKSIASYLNISRNVKCNYDQIVIVSGSLQSLYLIATTLINKGDSVVLENPSFPNVHSVFKSSQANLIPLEIDNDGIKIESLVNQKTKPKLIHVTPSNQYPLGVTMSLKRRREVLKWASKNKAFIIENDYENEIANRINAIPSIFSLDTEDRTIYMGTFNRLLHPSIRLGFMVVPQYLINSVEALQEHSHRFVSPSIQVVMNQFIEKNHLYRHLKYSIEIAKERYQLFCAEFEMISQKMVIPDKPCKSFHLVAEFKDQKDNRLEKEIIDKLEEQKITAHALSKCFIKPPKKIGLIFGYASVRPTILKQKIRLMKGIV
jgi:GntR family transcriptional regulator/MocR family aminotransferase